MQSVVFVGNVTHMHLWLDVRDCYCGFVMVKFQLLSPNGNRLHLLNPAIRGNTLPNERRL